MNLFNFFKSSSPAHNEIAENGADKVLSSEEENPSVHKTYVNFPTSRKSALDVPLYAISSGRSMVEMLGVLAIIGVLSVGAIAGYSKAMFKYKLNKQAEQLNTVLNAAARNALSFNNLNTGLNVTEYFVKMGEIPIEMVKDTSQSGCIYDAFNTRINIVYNVYPAYNRLIVTISPQLDIMNTENLEICRNILSVSKENSSNIYRLSVVSSYGDEDQAYLTIYGDISCTQGNLCFKNLSLDNIYELCTSAIGKQAPHIKIIWQNSLVR